MEPTMQAVMDDSSFPGNRWTDGEADGQPGRACEAKGTSRRRSEECRAAGDVAMAIIMVLPVESD